MANKIKRFWFIDNSGKVPRMGIVEKSTNAITKDNHTTDYKSVTQAKDITIYAISRDVDLSVDSLTSTWSAIPEQFHEVVVNKVIAMGYKKGKGFNIEKARFFDEEYNMGLREAKKFARSNYVTTGNIKPQDF
tara:strand:- start:562 stop:960 length:399 start_codon:yes stop_codon:yes gene_type:complete